MMDGNKTEQATPRRKKKARERGQVARSRDLTSGLGVMAAVLWLGWSAMRIPSLWRDFFVRTISEAAGRSLTSAPILSWSSGWLLAVAGPGIALAWLAAASGALAQGGLVFAPAALMPELARLNPARKLEQIFSLPSLSRLLRALLPAAAIVYLGATELTNRWGTLLGVPRMTSHGIGGVVLGAAYALLWKSGLVLLLWGGIDLLVERQHLAGELRMTRQELKDDYKETEGNPLIKGRIRRLQRQTLRRRMLEETKRASVVVTNPNEFAVALEYKPAMAAPLVIAKGRNLLAQQIKQVARWQGIPMVENPPLAHALYRGAQIGQYIPPKLYRPVAAILAAIYRTEKHTQGETQVPHG